MSIEPVHGLVHQWDPADALWQESVAVWFHDSRSGAGGFFRFGIHPNQGFGRFNLFAFVEGGHRFRRVRGAVDPIPIDARVGRPLRVGSCAADLDAEGRLAFTWDEPESSATLTMTEHFYRDHSFGGSGNDELDGLIYGGHLESSGRLCGTLRVGADEVAVDALVHRDRSWGRRDMSVVSTNRMITGTMGPELSFALNSIGLTNGHVANVGFVARDGVVEDVQEFVILPSIHIDGYSVESGVALACLGSGETLEITCRTIDGFLNPHDDYLCSEHISMARCGDLVGFCDNELTNNPRLGTQQPPHLLYAAGGDGLSRRPIREHRTWRTDPR